MRLEDIDNFKNVFVLTAGKAIPIIATWEFFDDCHLLNIL